MRWGPPPEFRHEPLTQEDVSPQLDFLYRSVDSFAQWTQFADAKAGGVALVLSVGGLNLFHKADDFINARHLHHPAWGWLSLLAFIVAVAGILVSVAGIGRALFPKIHASKPSDYFFGVVAARYTDGDSYGEAIMAKLERELIEDVAIQAWNLANIAHIKYRHLRYAYLGAFLFLAGWGVSRITLSLAT